MQKGFVFVVLQKLAVAGLSCPGSPGAVSYGLVSSRPSRRVSVAVCFAVIHC